TGGLLERRWSLTHHGALPGTYDPTSYTGTILRRRERSRHAGRMRTMAPALPRRLVEGIGIDPAACNFELFLCWALPFVRAYRPGSSLRRGARSGVRRVRRALWTGYVHLRRLPAGLRGTGRGRGNRHR